MTREEITEKLQAVFHDVFEDESIRLRDDMTAKDVKHWDSLNHINIIIASEQKFGISLTTKEALNLKNVGEFITLLQSKIK